MSRSAHIDRREFLRAAGLLAAGAVLLPGARRARAYASPFKSRHVVLVGIAGGLRLRESLGMAEGATLPSLLGDVPLLRGHGDRPAGAPRIAPEYQEKAAPLLVPKPPERPLYTQGALVTNLRYAEGAPGHLQGHACLVSGAYNIIENRRDAHAPAPTLFELHRRQANAPATDAWYVSLIGSFYRALQSSAHPEFGPRYGGSFLAPQGLMSALLPAITSGKRSLKVDGVATRLPVLVDPPEEAAAVQRLGRVLDQGFPAYEDAGAQVRATAEENGAFEQHLASFFADPTGNAYYPYDIGIGIQRQGGGAAGTGDAVTVYHAERILRRFKPAVMAVSLLDIDQCHADFNAYLRAQVIADACVRHLWDTIQSTDGLRDQTTLLVLPEHGRHLFMNGQNPDSLGRSGIDHGQGDDGDRDVFLLALGPDIKPGAVIDKTGVQQDGRTSGRYESIDATLSAATLLGYGDLMAQNLKGLGLRPGLVIQEMLR